MRYCVQYNNSFNIRYTIICCVISGDIHITSEANKKSPFTVVKYLTHHVRTFTIEKKARAGGGVRLTLSTALFSTVYGVNYKHARGRYRIHLEGKSLKHLPLYDLISQSIE